MTKTARKSILYTLFGLFLLFGAGTVFYAQGYRLDLGTFRIKKIGAIYAITHPKRAQLFINGKEESVSGGFLSSGTLLPGLFPKTYALSAKLDGYRTWERKVAVEPALVSEIQIILLPKEYKVVEKKTPQKFWALPGGSRLVRINDQLYWNDKLIPGAKLADNSADGSEVLSRGTDGFYFLNTANSDTTEVKNKKFPFLRGKLIFDTEPDKFINYSASSISLRTLENKSFPIWSVDLRRQSIQTADSSRTLVAWTVFDQKFGTSKLWTYDKFSGNTEDQYPELAGETAELKFSSGGKLAALQKNGDLYTYAPGADLARLTSNALQFEFSPSGKALAVLKDKTLEIYFENSDYLRLNLAVFEPVSAINWYKDEKHLFLSFPNRLGLLDLSALNPQDVQIISASTVYSYDPASNLLYLAENGTLLELDLPT